MINNKLVEHIFEYCEINDFGYVTVDACNYKDFAETLPLEPERPLDCSIMQGGYVSIHIDELQNALYFGDDTKKEIIKKLSAK